MQEIIKSPTCYDWTEFHRRPRGFMKSWAISHGFAYITVVHLVRGYYRSGAGPVIKQIIASALEEGLIHEIALDQAA